MLLTPKKYLGLTGKRAYRGLGQHFLIQPNTARQIVEALEIHPGDIVVEIGPGLGALTGYLIEYPCNLHLVEIDVSLAEALKSVMPPCRALVEWHIGDILNINWQEFLGQDSESEKSKNINIARSKAVLKVIGNIPYNISSPLLFHLISAHSLIDRAVLMVQREVGLRWTAEPGTKDYGVPTVVLKNCAKVERLFSVGHGQFFPPPKVESVVVRLKFFEISEWSPLSYEFFHRLVAEVFQQRRKTIINGLKSFFKRSSGSFNSDFIELCLEKTGISPSIRPEDVSPQGFVKLAKCLAGIEIPE